MTRPLIAISASGSPDAERLGFDEDHVKSLSIEIARLFLSLGCNLAYGGDLRSTGFTQDLLGMVARETEEMTRSGIGQQTNAPLPLQSQPVDPRLFSYIAWPFVSTLKKEQEALLLHTCRFRPVVPVDAGWDPQEAFDAQHALDQSACTPREARVTATCLTRMREIISGGDLDHIDPLPGAALRIVVGGRSNSHSGFVPGVIEEAALALRDKTPLIVVGGFGGGAGLLARALFRLPDPLGEGPVESLMPIQNEPYPAELGGEYQSKFAPFSKLVEADLQARQGVDPECNAWTRIEQLRKQLVNAAEDPDGALGNGLGTDENLALAGFGAHALGPGDERTILALIEKSAAAVLKNHPAG